MDMNILIFEMSVQLKPESGLRMFSLGWRIHAAVRSLYLMTVRSVFGLPSTFYDKRAMIKQVHSLTCLRTFYKLIYASYIMIYTIIITLIMTSDVPNIMPPVCHQRLHRHAVVSLNPSTDHYHPRVHSHIKNTYTCIYIYTEKENYPGGDPNQEILQ